MASPKQATAYTFTTELVSQADVKLFQSNPTLASGDVKISKDQGAFANLATLPTITPASGRQVKVVLSATEMTADDVGIEFVDAAGAEWCDAGFHFSLTVRNADDLAFPTTSGRSTDTDAAGNVDARLADAVSHGGTLGSSTATLALKTIDVTNSGGDAVYLRSTSVGGSALYLFGEVTAGYGVTIDGATGMQITAEANNSAALGLYAPATGPCISLNGGYTSGDAVSIVTTSGHGINITAAGSGKHGIISTGGTNGDGMRLVGNGTGADLNLAGTTYISGDFAAFTESYAADGATVRLSQALYEILSFLEERSISGTTITCKKRDGSTTALTLTTNSATQPTSTTRAT